MTKRGLTLLGAAAVLAAGCSYFRWSGYGGREPAAVDARSAAGAVPEAPPERRKAALFYSDLGPDAVDVSSYPPELKRGYEAYARVCSRCHALARSINAPYVGRGWWEFYIASMRMRAKFYGEPLSAEEIGSILDFIEYDSNRRKVARAPEFERTKAALKRRFDAELDERMQQLQQQPPLLPAH